MLRTSNKKSDSLTQKNKNAFNAKKTENIFSNRKSYVVWLVALQNDENGTFRVNHLLFAF